MGSSLYCGAARTSLSRWLKLLREGISTISHRRDWRLDLIYPISISILTRWSMWIIHQKPNYAESRLDLVDLSCDREINVDESESKVQGK